MLEVLHLFSQGLLEGMPTLCLSMNYVSFLVCCLLLLVWFRERLFPGFFLVLLLSILVPLRFPPIDLVLILPWLQPHYMSVVSLLLPPILQLHVVIWFHEVIKVGTQNFCGLFPGSVLVPNPHPRLVHGHHFRPPVLRLGLDHLNSRRDGRESEKFFSAVVGVHLVGQRLIGAAAGRLPLPRRYVTLVDCGVIDMAGFIAGRRLAAVAMASLRVTAAAALILFVLPFVTLLHQHTQLLARQVHQRR
mmetsp:Transcript_34453/g.73382  ORF Transcript_34453/g.73382 Transcript_34453/m.73382 type:complete len:246 (-) Transcript_34453:839-1576(-)